MRRVALGCVWLLLFTATASAEWLLKEIEARLETTAAAGKDQ